MSKVSKRRARKMLRAMADGDALVKIISARASLKRLARLVYIAEQFGYVYADARRGGGPQDNGFMAMIVPDPSPEAQARAERNRARYPDANGGVSLPNPEPADVELISSRIMFDLSAAYTPKEAIVLVGIGWTILCLCFGATFREHPAAIIGAGVLWVVLMALLPFLARASRRRHAKYVATLEAAGFTQVTDWYGQLRYVPPGREHPWQHHRAPDWL